MRRIQCVSTVRGPRRLPLCFFLGLILLFSACRETALHHKLTEDNANEILVLLDRNGIDAKKVSEEKNQEITWNVVVPAKDEARARKILVENHMPRERAMGFNEVCKDEGLIPTPKREKCRELLAYKGELINVLESVSGVVDADVVLNMPEKDPYLEAGQANLPPTASVVIKTSVNGLGAAPLKEEQIQRFVANAIPGMDPRNVSVIITSVEAWNAPTNGGVVKTPAPAVTITQSGAAPSLSAKTAVQASDRGDYVQVLGLRVHEDSVDRFKKMGMLAMGAFLLVSAILMLVLYFQVRGRSAKKSAESVKGNELLASGERGSERLLDAPL